VSIQKGAEIKNYPNTTPPGNYLAPKKRSIAIALGGKSLANLIEFMPDNT